MGIGITALGPRKKIEHAISQLRNGSAQTIESHGQSHVVEPERRSTNGVVLASEGTVDDTSKPAPNKLITDYFRGSAGGRKKVCTPSNQAPNVAAKKSSGSGRKHGMIKNRAMNGKPRDPPLWCCIPGTPFRVVSDFSMTVFCSYFLFVDL